MQVQRNRREKDFFFYELFLSSATSFFFFLSRPLFIILFLFLSIRNSSLHQRLFQNPRFIINLPIFIVFCSGLLLGGHLKKNTQWLCFFCSHLDLCFLFHWTVIVFFQIINKQSLNTTYQLGSRHKEVDLNGNERRKTLLSQCTILFFQNYENVYRCLKN